MKNILWLASWYPDEMNPFNGDFIQRHAFAVSLYQPITVVYMAQHGPDKEMPASKVLVSNHGNLVELTVYFPYRKTGVRSLDKLRYNWKYFFHFRKFMRKYLVEKQKPDLIHVHIPMKAGRIAFWLNKTLRIPYIVTEHSSAYSDEVPDNFQRRGNYYRKWVRLIFEHASAVTTVSKKLGDRLTTMFGILGMHIIPNVADIRFFNFTDHKPPRFRFLHASTMDHPKNVEGMLRALSQLKELHTNWDCVMLGWDNAELRKLSSSLGLDGHVVWKGVVAYQQVAIEMQQSSALLMFSRYENLPCVILEALCCGLPVIATAVGGIPEVINKMNGVLVNPANEEELTEAMSRMITDHVKYDRQLIAQHSRDRFSYQAVGRQFVELYEKVLGRS